MDIQQAFDNLCTDRDFLDLYGEHTGDFLPRLTIAQLFSTGSLYHVVNIKFADGSGELRLCDGYHDITFNNQLYIASGDFLDIQNPTRSKELNNTGMSVRVSNVRPEYVTMIKNKQFDKAVVTIRMVFLNPMSGAVMQDFGVFQGEIDSSSISLDFSNDEEWKSETDIKINSFWAVLEKNARSHCTDGVHRSYAGNENDGFFAKIGMWNSEAVWKTKQ